MIDVNFWQGLYESGETPWDLGRASPHFPYFLQKQGRNFPPGRMAVPGAGRGHDAALFAREGYDVTAFDYAPSALEEARKLHGDLFDYVQTDIFNMDDAWEGRFDYVLEHTCFCAIKPKQRPDYVSVAAGLLKPGGHLLGVFWEHEQEEGPPYTTSLADIQTHFAPWFEIVSQESRTPALGRNGIERLAVLRRKPNPN